MNILVPVVQSTGHISVGIKQVITENNAICDEWRAPKDKEGH